MEPDTLFLPELFTAPIPDSLGASPVLVLDTAADYSMQPLSVQEYVAETRLAWQDGLEPESLRLTPGNLSPFILFVAIVIVLVLLSFNTLKRMLALSFDELFTVRHGRDNVFDERPAYLTSVQWLLTAIFVFCGGFLFGSGVSAIRETVMTPVSLGCFIALTGAYYFFELFAYSVVGYTFTDEEGRREWLRGFNMSVCILSLLLIVPAMIVGFYPGASFQMAVLGLVLFILAKIIFIFKGFRIFYDDFFSLLYFILYLCTLEIIPIIFVYNCSARFIG